MTPARIRAGVRFVSGRFLRTGKQVFQGSALPQEPLRQTLPFLLLYPDAYTRCSAGGTQWTKRSPAGKTQRSNMPAALLPVRHSAAARAAFWPRAASCARSLPAAQSWRPCFIPKARMEKCPELADSARRALSGGGSCGRQAGRRGHPSGGVRRVPHPGAHAWKRCSTGGRYLALERVQDPGNVGTLLRCCSRLWL